MLLDLERAHGRSALVLSGGGSYGCFHLGTVRALLKRGVLPKVIAGSSSGALIAALVCTRSPENLEVNLMDDEYVIQNGLGWFSETDTKAMLRRLLTRGSAQGAAPRRSGASPSRTPPPPARPAAVGPLPPCPALLPGRPLSQDHLPFFFEADLLHINIIMLNFN